MSRSPRFGTLPQSSFLASQTRTPGKSAITSLKLPDHHSGVYTEDVLDRRGAAPWAAGAPDAGRVFDQVRETFWANLRAFFLRPSFLARARGGCPARLAYGSDNRWTALTEQ